MEQEVGNAARWLSWRATWTSRHNAEGQKLKQRLVLLLGWVSPFPRVRHAWHQLRPSPHFLRWEAEVRMQGVKGFP